MRQNTGALLSRFPKRRPRNHKHELVFGVILALLLSCGTTTRRLVRAYTLSVQALYPEALQIAKAWQEDAYFTGVRTDFGVRAPDERMIASFVFLSPSAPQTLLFITYDSFRGSLEEESQDPVGEFNPDIYPKLSDEDWPLDSTEALEIAQAHGGSDFLARRSSHDLYLYLRLQKKVIEGQLVPVWRAYYGDRTASNYLCLTINAQTGDLVSDKCVGEE